MTIPAPLSGSFTMGTVHIMDRPVTTQELAESLIEVLGHLQTSYDMVCVPAVYRSKAQILRDQADELEKKDRDIEKARLILNTYKKYNKEKENE